MSTATTVEARVGGERQQLGGGVVVAQSLVAVGHHGAAAVPAATADDVHGVHREGIGGAHHGADVGVAAEVLDRDVQRVPAGVDVGDDRLARPIAVRVNDVAGVAVAQQVGVIAWVIRWRARPRADARRIAPLGGPGSVLTSPVVHSAACVPTSDTDG